jgi:isopropylmalate/homocitrate/citramalate synthase
VIEPVVSPDEDGRRVQIGEVGPRDGLQNESVVLEPATRAELCNRLADAGLQNIEAVSFVNPTRVPPMAGAEEVVAGLERRPGVVYSGLVLNDRGYERAVAAAVDEIHYAFPVTDTFCERNQGSTVADSTALAYRLIDRCASDGLPLTITLAVSFGCPFEGAVDPDRVVSIAEQLHEHGAETIVLADSIGVGVPSQVRDLVRRVEQLGATVGCHFHNTRNTGFANAVAAVEVGAAFLDASVGGTGGCPFAPRATGNIATEDLVYLLHGMGYETGVQLEALIECANWLSEKLGKELPGLLYKAGVFAPVAA